MREYTWEEFYDRSIGWNELTIRRFAGDVKCFGPAEEVCEVAVDMGKCKSTDSFLLRAMDAGVRFTPEQIVDLSWYVQKPTLARLVQTSAVPFSREELEDIDLYLDENTLAQARSRAGIREKPSFITSFVNDTIALGDRVEKRQREAAPEPPARESGLLAALLMSLSSPKGGKCSSSQCDGDCAHCPPHYGYRYGRWYYGHSHAWGCERGGNHGDGRD